MTDEYKTFQTTLAGEPSTEWDRRARVDEAELTDASDDLLIAEALLKGVPGRETESLWWLRFNAAPLGEAGTDTSDEAAVRPLLGFCERICQCSLTL